MFGKVIKYSFYFLFTVLFTSCQKEDIYSNQEYKTLGSAAHDLLSADRYQSLIIQVNYMPGYQPDNTVITAFKSFLTSIINKPGGIIFSMQPITASNKIRLTLQDIVKIEKDNRTAYTAGNTVAVYILISDGFYDDNNIFATLYWNTSYCLFGKAISESSGSAGQISYPGLMTLLMEHEFGHLLGLVDQGSPMLVNHRDLPNGAHCNNNNCLMNYGIEISSPSPTSSLPALDSNCQNDLKANGGK